MKDGLRDLRDVLADEVGAVLLQMGANGADVRRARSLVRHGSDASLRSARVVIWSSGRVGVLADVGDDCPSVRRSGAVVEKQVDLLTFARETGRTGRARKEGIKV